MILPAILSLVVISLMLLLAKKEQKAIRVRQEQKVTRVRRDQKATKVHQGWRVPQAAQAAQACGS